MFDAVGSVSGDSPRVLPMLFLFLFPFMLLVLSVLPLLRLRLVMVLLRPRRVRYHSAVADDERRRRHVS